MSKFIRNISLFVAGLPLLTTKSVSASPLYRLEVQPIDEPGAVPLRPLNRESDNLFAGHRSHSSHRSHYSGAGGGSSTYREPAYRPAVPAPAPATPINRLVEGQPPAAPPSAAKAGIPSGAVPREELTHPEMLRLQVMRVQIKLKSLGLYQGPVDGVMN